MKIQNRRKAEHLPTASRRQRQTGALLLDGDFSDCALCGLGDIQLEDAVLVGGIHLVGLDRIGDPEAPVERTV